MTTVNGVRQVTCASVQKAGVNQVCGTGEYVRGVNNDGSLDCATIQTVPSCAVSVSPASPTTAQSFTLTVTTDNFSAAGDYTYRWKFDTQSRILREETTAMTSDTLSINAGDIANPYNSPYYVTVTKGTQSTSCGIVVPVVAATVPSCSGGSVSWTVNNKTCTGSRTTTVVGSSDTAIDSNRPPTGSATYHCNNDRTWGEPTSASCADDPPHCQEDDEVTWTVGSHTCTGSRDETNSGSSDTATDSTGPSTGSATYSCNNGAWTEPTNTSCESTTLPPLKCSGGSVDWSVDNHDCTGSRDETNSGSSDTATDSTGPSTGSATYSCNNGDWIATSMSCGYGDPPCNCTPSATDSTTAGTRATPHTWCKRSCAGRTVRWTVNGKTCSGSLPEVTPEADIGENPTTVWDTTGTTRGRAIYDCNDGTLSNPLFAWCTSATTSCAADTVSWTKNGRTCTASRPMAPSGGEVFIRSTEGTSRGSAKYLCTNGTWSDEPSFALCDRTCAGGTVNWTVGSHTCTGTRTTTRHGGGSVARDATKPTIGVAAYRCVNGTWRTMFSRYDASWIFWRHWSDNMHDSIWLSGTGATCSSTSCPADIVTWSEDNNRICRFSRSITPSGAYANLLDTDGSTGGGGFYKCNDNGSWDDADSTNACTTSGCLQDGVCDTSRQNRCSSGTLYNDANDSAVADTTTHYKWRCDGRNGGKNSPVCEKEKPCGTCNCTTSKTDATNAGTCSTTGNTCTVSANNCPKSPKCGSWSPARNTVCSGTRFTQFRTCNTECNNCATSRLTTGTKPQSGTWSPARNTVCSGKRFTQSRTCGSRSTTGTKPATNCQWGPWSDWSTCSNGSQSRSRSKTVTESTCGTCSGSSTQSQCCGSGCTPVPCVCTASKTDAANKGTLSDGSGACTVTANNCPTKTCNCTTSKTDATNAGTWSDGSGACNEANNCPQTPVCNNAEVDECLVGRKSNTGTRCQDTTTLDRWCCIGKPDTEIAYCDIKKPGCEDKDVTWGTQCGGSTGTASASGSKVVANTKSAGYTGSATYSCNDETWSGPTAASCQPISCPLNTVSWTVPDDQDENIEYTCNSTLASTTASSGTAIDSTGHNRGFATYSCTDGDWASSPNTGAKCGPGACVCTVGTGDPALNGVRLYYQGPTWRVPGGPCQREIACPVNGVCNNSERNGCLHGTHNDKTYTDTDTHYRWQCDGTSGDSKSPKGYNSPRCSKKKPPGCGTTRNTCSPGYASGGYAMTTTTHYKWRCSYGGVTIDTCSVAKPPGCSARSVTWGSCSTTLSARTTNGTVVARDTDGDYQGSRSYSCNNQTWTGGSSIGTCNQGPCQCTTSTTDAATAGTYQHSGNACTTSGCPTS